MLNVIKPKTLRLTEAQRATIQSHIFPGDGCEAVALATCGKLLQSESSVFCIHEIYPVPYASCSNRTETAVKWDVSELIPVLQKAAKREQFVLKIHSHPTGYEAFSSQDGQSDSLLSESIINISEGQCLLVSAFMTQDNRIKARLVKADGAFENVDVIVVGDEVTFPFPLSTVQASEQDLRTRQTFGEGTNQILRNLKVGVVGCSGTGSWVIEMLGRLGVGALVLVDPDSIEKKNLNRIINSELRHAENSDPKVEILEKAVKSMGFGTEIVRFNTDLINREVVEALASCDFLFGCMDSADGRDVLNRIATYYLLPYIDVGVRLEADGRGKVGQIYCAVHYLIPGGSSLLSRGVITAEQVAAQSMLRHNPDEFRKLEKEGYIKGANIDRPAVVSINGFAASHAVNEMLARIHSFRRDPNSEFRYQLFSLADSAWLRFPDGDPCALLAKFVGRGDSKPLLGLPTLS